ncbi:MAG: DEAD/DEAH box helicase [Nitrospira sp.]|nr:DEAD/DEAH box helicase [Nitrospira sp.]MDE0404129.1 DEAD/DEAH box helicase [Nitrospira sp.]MDE0487338.1 DEAD/DEAH box helicase [Nitrospira sp.]
MTNDALAKHLTGLPVRLLHRLAKNRVHRHFRMGKTRLIQSLLSLPPEQRSEIETTLTSFLPEPPRPSKPSKPDRAAKPNLQPDAPSRPAPPSRQHQVPTEAAISTQALLEGIGVPPPQPFKPDDWQREAINCLATNDVILSVPTGSGKTYVAIEAMRRAIEAERTVIYTSPLKALSNTKLTEFSQLFGADQVGILTGDRRDNPQAPILIMTTEILRNLLYDAASGEIDMRLDTLGLIILDESQFLADAERGVVWEETIIFAPAQSRLLLLSASIGNPEEVAAWIGSIRSTSCHLIQHRKRSVPLRAAYLDPSGKLAPFFRTRDIASGKDFALHPETKRLFANYEDRTLGPRYRR